MQYDIVELRSTQYAPHLFDDAMSQRSAYIHPARVLFPLGLGTALSLVGDTTLYAVLPTHTAEAGVADRHDEAAMRDKVTLRCDDCKRRNYMTTKNKKRTTGKLELSKYCRWCRKHTPHKETR